MMKVRTEMANQEKKREYLQNQSHEQLVIFVMNGDDIQDDLRERLFLLSGCEDFGDCDGMNGTCYDCYIENKERNFRCRAFQEMMSCYRRLKSQYGDESETKL